MRLLPGLPLIKSIVKCQLSIVLFLFSLFTLTLTPPAFAAHTPNPLISEPTPQPCKNPVPTEKLTDNYVTDPTKEEGAPIVKTFGAAGLPGDSKTITISEKFEVNFSKLQSLFGTTNSDYLEGKFQNENHARINLLNITSPQEFNNFHGPGQKAAPKVMVDELKVKYVDYILKHSHLPEAFNVYTDIYGNQERKVIDMYRDFGGLPIPPKSGEDRAGWLTTWGRYWEKIPTAYSEFYEGELHFKFALKKQLESIKKGEHCPISIRGPIKFIMPEFWRTISISNQLNQVIVPCAAQSWRHGAGQDQCGTELTSSSQNNNQDQSPNILAKAINFCKDLLANSSEGLAKTLRKVIKISLDLVNPLKPVFAQEQPTNPSCLVTVRSGKSSTAPYCALPPGSLQSGDSCRNQNDLNKLDKDNPNVVCTFQINYQLSLNIGSEEWDSCTPPQEGDETISCTLTVYIWPDFKIPWLAEIWNNTLYSDEDEARVGSPQETGRPGVYSFFMPQAVSPIRVPLSYLEAFAKCSESNPDACQRLLEIAKTCLSFRENPLNLFKCINQLTPKNLPGQTQASSANDAKERFIGATDCAKEFTRNIALKPIALQREQGIEQQCKTNL